MRDSWKKATGLFGRNGPKGASHKSAQSALSSPAKLVLWTGPKHSGKSTAAGRLVRRATAEGFSVAGIIAPAVYRDCTLVGFDVVSIPGGVRLPLARIAGQTSSVVRRFVFQPEGLQLGNDALDAPSARSAALVIVDEFGPIELSGHGWRRAMDRLVDHFGGVLLLVVRQELVDEVAHLYFSLSPPAVAASNPDAVEQVLSVVQDRASGRAS